VKEEGRGRKKKGANPERFQNLGGGHLFSKDCDRGLVKSVGLSILGKGQTDPANGGGKEPDDILFKRKGGFGEIVLHKLSTSLPNQE